MTSVSPPSPPPAIGPAARAVSPRVVVRENRAEPFSRLLNPAEPWRRIWANRGLIVQMTRRDVAQQHRGTLLGPIWPVAQPLITLAVYTFVFSVIIHSSWGEVNDTDPGRHATFVLYFFCGYLLYNGFAATCAKASVSVAARPQYVNRIVFPVETLPVVVVYSLLFTIAIEAVLLLIVTVAMTGGVPSTAALLPAVFVPQVLLMLGAAWWLAALGVFFRDVREVVQVVTRFVFFLTPVFWPIALVKERLPKWAGDLIWLNPMVTIIESARDLLLRGQMHHWPQLALVTAFAWVLMHTGFVFFCRQRRGFDAAL